MAKTQPIDSSNSTNLHARQARATAIAKQSAWFPDQAFTLNTVKGSKSSNLQLSPAGNTPTEFNIVEDYLWTYSKYRDEVPRIRLVEKQITGNQQLSFMWNSVKNVGTYAWHKFPFTSDAELDPYAGLYDAEPTKFTYVLPYYTAHMHTSKSQWDAKVPEEGNVYSATVGGVVKAAGGAIGGLAGAAMQNVSFEQAQKFAAGIGGMTSNSPFAGIEQPKFFTGPEYQSYTIKFPLFNTGSLAEIRQNYDFVRVFAYQNLHDRVSLTTYRPPVMYSCESTANHMSPIGSKPALYVSNLNIANVGALHSIALGISDASISNKVGRVLIPEAYMVEITLTELIATSRQIYTSVFTKDSIVSTDRPADPVADPTSTSGKSGKVVQVGTMVQKPYNPNSGAKNSGTPNLVPRYEVR